jgi:hypothetical protein
VANWLRHNSPAYDDAIGSDRTLEREAVPPRRKGGIWRPSVDETDNYVSAGAL